MPGIKNLRNKIVVITGAGSGIGRATALAFADEGARLVLADIDNERLKGVRDEVEKRGVQGITRQTDVSDKKQVENLAHMTMDKFGRVDVLFNNAGVTIGGEIQDTPLENWEWLVGINYWGVVYGIYYFLPHMIAQKSGHIVNTSSITGLCAWAGSGAYSSTKHAVAGLGESLRAELASQGIGVTTICPGVIDTRAIVDGRSHLKKESRANNESVADFYKNRGWPPERVARAVVKAVRKNRSVVPVGPEAWLQWYAKRLSNPLYQWLNATAYRFLR